MKDGSVATEAMKEEFANRWTDTNTPGCHLWTAERTAKGFAKFIYKGETYWADRLAWEVENQTKLLDGKKLRHTCGRASCVNPFHMEVEEMPLDIGMDMPPPKRAPAPPAAAAGALMAATIAQLQADVAVLKVKLEMLEKSVGGLRP